MYAMVGKPSRNARLQAYPTRPTSCLSPPGSPKVPGVIQDLSTAEYRCPGETYGISRAVHLGRLAGFHPACRDCPRRDDAVGLSARQIRQLAEVGSRAKQPPLFHAGRGRQRGDQRSEPRRGAEDRDRVCPANYGFDSGGLPIAKRRRSSPATAAWQRRRSSRRSSKVSVGPAARPSTSDRQARRVRPGPSNTWLPTEAFSWAMPTAPRTPSG